MNKKIKTQKVNDYISIEYDIEKAQIFKIWYSSKKYACDCLYDVEENKFFAFSTLLDFLTETQKKQILKRIYNIKNRNGELRK